LERNKTKTDDLVSNLWKFFVTKAFNTGIIILLINTKIDSLNPKEYLSFSPILKGEYNDFNPSWYYNVGSTIITALIILIFTPHLGTCYKYFMAKYKRHKDSKTTNGEGSKLKREKFIALYTGPEFELDSRFSDVYLLYLYKRCSL
jgi:hypothetical protein